MYGVKKVKKSSKQPKANYYRHSPKEQTKKQSKKKASQVKSRGHKTFSRLARKLKKENNLKRKQNYKNLEKRLNINQNKWGVEAIANKIINLISTKYKILINQNLEKEQQQIINEIYSESKTIIKQGFKEAQETILPLPQEVNHLLTATYRLTQQKLTAWQEKESNHPTIPQGNLININHSPDLKQEITKLFTKQGIYLKESKTKLPAINLRG